MFGIKEGLVHGFGRGLGTDSYEPAVLRGKTEIVDGQPVDRPLVWGEERLCIRFPSGLDSYGYSQCIDVSQDRNLVAVSYGEIVSIFELPGWDRKAVLRLDSIVSQISFSPDSRHLLTYSTNEDDEYSDNGGEDDPDNRFNVDDIVVIQRICIWDLIAEFDRTKALLPVETAENLFEAGVHREILGMTVSTWSPDGTRLLLNRQWDPEIRPHYTRRAIFDLIIWDVVSNEESALKLQQADNDSPYEWIGFINDGQWIACCCGPKEIQGQTSIQIWDANNGTLVRKLPYEIEGQMCSVKFSPDLKYLATGENHGYLRITDIPTEKQLYRFSIYKPELPGGRVHHEWMRVTEFTPDSKSIICTNSAGSAAIFSLETGLQTHLYLFNNVPSKTPHWEIQDVQISPNGNRFCFHLPDGHIIIYDMDKNESWEIEQTLSGPRDPAFGVLRFLDKEGKMAVSYDAGGVLRVWDL